MVFLKNTMKTVVLHGGKLDRTTWPFPSLKRELRGGLHRGWEVTGQAHRSESGFEMQCVFVPSPPLPMRCPTSQLCDQ